MIKKKGLSTVVTTLIIILLVLVAIGIVWVVIANLVQEGSEQIFLDKFTTDLKIKDVLNIDNSTDSLDIDIKRNAGKGDLAGIKFIFNDGTNSEVIEITNVTLEELGEKRFHFTLTTLDIDNVQTVSIAPLYKSSEGKTITGGIIASYRLSGAGVLGTCTPDCGTAECGYNDGCGGSCVPIGQDPITYCADTYGPGFTCVSGTCQDTSTTPCTFSSALWNPTTVVQYNTANLNIQGSDCNGKDILFEIYEYDGAGDDYITNMTVTFPATGTSASASWVTDYQSGDIFYDNQYYFVASVSGEGTITSSAPRLTVTQAPQTCAAQGGDICVGAETCGGTILTASDSNRCCDQTCSAPVTSQVYREFSSTTVAPGGQINVAVYVYTLGGETYYALEDFIPSGWTIINADGGATSNSTRLAWTWVEGSAAPYDTRNDPFVYTVQAPASTGTYTFGGIYGLEGGSVITTLGGTAVTVA